MRSGCGRIHMSSTCTTTCRRPSLAALPYTDSRSHPHSPGAPLMNRLLAIAVAVSLAAAPAIRADELAAGNWKITSLSANGASATTNWLLKLETTGGKTAATLAAANPGYKQSALKSFTIKGDTVRAVVVGNNFEQVFEGRINKDGKKVLGTF